ncbi:hypothetical protein ACFPM7_18240 [Actinokineospora guangxiensis]|uniref:Uncharacterized protein n=1 Tax=Actinokineospora guangxiensis TaxID=1490288 RepID=A0ABW0EQ80_9PSEU
MSHGREVIRESDGELVGYVREADGDLWSPLTVFGFPLGPDAPYEDARAAVESTGMAALAEPWQYRDADGEWYACAIQEANPDRVRVTITDLGHPDAYQSRTVERPSEALRR